MLNNVLSCLAYVKHKHQLPKSYLSRKESGWHIFFKLVLCLTKILQTNLWQITPILAENKTQLDTPKCCKQQYSEMECEDDQSVAHTYHNMVQCHPPSCAMPCRKTTNPCISGLGLPPSCNTIANKFLDLRTTYRWLLKHR
jgi:hypothetical protein